MELSLFIVGISSNSRRKINLSWKNKKRTNHLWGNICLVFWVEGVLDEFKHLDWKSLQLHNILRKSKVWWQKWLGIDIYVSPEAIKYAPGFISSNTQKKGIFLQPDWSEKYNKHIK